MPELPIVRKMDLWSSHIDLFSRVAFNFLQRHFCRFELYYKYVQAYTNSPSDTH